VCKSPHVNKKSREQFEIRIHSRIIDIMSATPDTIDSLMKLDLAPEVDVEVRSMGKE
jgi:small subunit ribosomal protein S10